jgi:hypothetical protein
VTFSIGVLICTDAPHTVVDLINLIDSLIYAVNNDGKTRLANHFIGLIVSGRLSGSSVLIVIGDSYSSR